MSDVERWLTTSLTEVDDSDAILEKECLCESFFTFIRTSPEVGREKFFSLLGNALLNVGYKKVKPVIKKGRRVAYAGMAFKKECTSAKLFEAKKTAISAHTVQQWMKDHYCEGGESDVISSEDLWIHFRDKCGIQEDQRSLFLSLLGKSVLKKHPFLNVRRQLTRNLQEKKVAIFQYLRVRKLTDIDDNVNELQDSGSSGQDFVQDEDPPTKPPEQSNEASHVVVSMPITGFGKDDLCNVPLVDMEKESSAINFTPPNEDIELEEGNIDEIEEPIEYEEKAEETREEKTVVTEEVHDGEQQGTKCEGAYKEELELSASVEEVYSDSNYSDSESDIMGENANTSDDEASKSQEEKVSPADDNFHKYHKKMDDMRPRYLPGRPTSFDSYLKSVFPDPSNMNVERQDIHPSSAGTSVYKHARIRAFVTVCFPPIKVGSLAGECNSPTFEGDVFPQFSQVDKSTFSCEICIPYCRWSILNNKPYSSARSKQASVDAILAGTAKLMFSGMVQVHEHSVSKCHVEATKFWSKDKVQTPTDRTSVKKDVGRKERTFLIILRRKLIL